MGKELFVLRAEMQRDSSVAMISLTGEKKTIHCPRTVSSPSELFSSHVVVGFGSEDRTSKILSSPCENKYCFAAQRRLRVQPRSQSHYR
jgi:hypothetical protein